MGDLHASHRFRCTGSFAEVAYLKDDLVRADGRVTLLHPELECFALSIGKEDHVVLEVTGNTAAIEKRSHQLTLALWQRRGREIAVSESSNHLPAEPPRVTDYEFLFAIETKARKS